MQRVPDHATAVRLSGGDPWVRWSIAAPLAGEVWIHDGVLLVERPGSRRGFWVAPVTAAGVEAAPESDQDEGRRVRAALVELRDGGHLQRLGSRSLSVVQAHAAVAHEVLEMGNGGDWDWMWVDASTASLPDGPSAAVPLSAIEVVLHDVDDAEEISAFTHRHNPHVWTQIGTGRVHHWVGLRGLTGDLLALGGAEREATGVPHLAGIVTDRSLRCRGLGTAVTLALSRWALAEGGVCTLGMFSDNEPARAIYHRLGYRTARAWHSGDLLGPG